MRDLHFGFLPDDWEKEYYDYFQRIAKDENFAWRCLRTALLSRNESLVTFLLDSLIVTRSIEFVYLRESLDQFSANFSNEKSQLFSQVNFNSRETFTKINDSLVDALLLEAVERDDLESIEGILSWRKVKASSIGLTEVDHRLLR